MAASLEAFNALPLKQRVGIICGAGVVVALVIGYFLYEALNKLGKDDEDPLSFMMVESSNSIWGQIEVLDGEIAKFQARAKQLPMLKKKLDDLKVTIRYARKKLPREKEFSKIGDELGFFAQQVVNEDLGSIEMKSIDIREQNNNQGGARRRKPVPGALAEPQQITFKCQVETDTDGLIAFINKVERSDERLMTIDGIDITPGDVSANTDSKEVEYSLHSVQLEINTWVLKE